MTVVWFGCVAAVNHFINSTCIAVCGMISINIVDALATDLFMNNYTRTNKLLGTLARNVQFYFTDLRVLCHFLLTV